MKRLFFALAGLSLLSACDERPMSNGRWQVVSAGPGATNDRAAWRIDTATGALQYCSFWEGIVSCGTPYPGASAPAVATAAPPAQ